jgi:hypothetical protein
MAQAKRAEEILRPHTQRLQLDVVEERHHLFVLVHDVCHEWAVAGRRTIILTGMFRGCRVLLGHEDKVPVIPSFMYIRSQQHYILRLVQLVARFSTSQ